MVHEITERMYEAANERQRRDIAHGAAISVSFDPSTRRVGIDLNTGITIWVPVDQVEGLAGASDEMLREIEISPSGLGLHWPQLDADVSVPSLMAGLLGSRRWMAEMMGAAGGRATTEAKAAAARANGQRGGRPRAVAASQPPPRPKMR